MKSVVLRLVLWTLLAGCGSGDGGDEAGCVAPFVDCGVGTCVNIESSGLHCGGCGRACRANETCLGGICRPPSGCVAPRTVCSNLCVDTLSDAAHCGACGRACSFGGSCVGGACVACPASHTVCLTRCVDTRTHHDHCGGCGRPCLANEECASGTCRNTTSACADRDCGPDGVGGTCGVCGPDQACTASGRCVARVDGGAPVDSCAGATSCAACTPLAGCGWCGATGRCVRINATCTAPESGACGAGWACQPTDCPGSTECRPCTADSECVSGTCAVRLCDGRRTCTPLGRPPVCATVGGVACPTVPAYRRCTSDTQCGPRMRCLEVYPGQSERVCKPPCTAPSECPRTTTQGVGVPFCETAGVCTLGCTGPGTCDEDLTCRRSIAGTYGFCL